MMKPCITMQTISVPWNMVCRRQQARVLELIGWQCFLLTQLRFVTFYCSRICVNKQVQYVFVLLSVLANRLLQETSANHLGKVVC